MRSVPADRFTIGWVCALPLELAAAIQVMDEKYESLPQPANDSNSYFLGRIGNHNVVVACLPSGQIGTSLAATVASQMKASFTSIECRLLVGIGGGVPSAKNDIRLGDVVISQPFDQHNGVVQYDFGKTGEDGKVSRTGSLNSPPQILLTALSSLRSLMLREKTAITAHMHSFSTLPAFARPNSQSDVLFLASSKHISGETCAGCPIKDQVKRLPRSSLDPVLFTGTIASGNQVMKDGTTRDRVSQDLGGVLCFEMEAAGLMQSFPSLIIRGICDYADAHKAKQWQHYAAAVAAACAKELLLMISASERDHEEIQAKKNQLFNLEMSLGSIDYKSHKNRNPAPVEGTCTWLLEHNTFTRWYRNPTSALLWLSDNPGCGKSVLARFLVDHFQKTASATTIVSYFFFKSDNLDQMRGANAVKTVLKQSYQQRKDIRDIGLDLLKNGNIDKLEELWNTLVKSVEYPDSVDVSAGRPKPQAYETICVLDGLDECEISSRSSLINLIAEYFWTRKTNATEGRSRFKMIILSRPDTRIKLAFEYRPRAKDAIVEDSEGDQGKAGALNPVAMVIRCRGEDETEAKSLDITRVVHDKVDRLMEKGLPPSILQRFRNELVQRADRTFLWVALILDLLEQQVEAGASRRKLDELLRNRDIFLIYRDLLEARPNSHESRKLLQIMLAAIRPLTIEEASIALAVTAETNDKDFGTITFDDVEYDLVYPYENHVKALCGHFIRLIRGKLYFAHETAREYLLSSTQMLAGSLSTQSTLTATSFTSIEDGELEKRPRNTFQNAFSMPEAQALMLNICVTYIYCLARKSECSEVGAPSNALAAFLDYAAKSWAIHSQQSRQEKERLSWKLYANLCDPDFPGFDTWIEAYWHPLVPISITGTKQIQQDFYLDHFEMQETLGDRDIDTDDDSISDLEETNQFWRDKKAQALEHAEREMSTSSFYNSNPGSLSQAYFPRRVDASGVVRLALVEEDGSSSGN